MKKTKKPYRITIACQKGGAGKSTTSIILAYVLSTMGYRVLLVDTDQQGNSSETFTEISIRDFRLQGYLGIKYALEYIIDPQFKKPENHPSEFIWKLSDTLDLMPSDERVGFFFNSPLIHKTDRPNHILNDMLDLVDSEYDFVVIDTAPALSPMLTNALVSSDGVIAMYQPEKYCYSAMFSLFETFDDVREVNPKLKSLGILTALSEARRSDMGQFISLMKANDELGKHCFKTVIRRCAPTGRLSYAGFFKNPEVAAGIKQYLPFIKELMKRVKEN